jgi:hypothetical protein
MPVIVFSQNNEPTIQNNSNIATPTAPATSEQIYLMDSVAFEKANDKGIAPKAKKEELKMEKKTSAIDTQQQAKTVQMKNQFQTNQKSASTNTTRRSASPTEQKNMDESVSFYQAFAPASFETNLYAYQAGHFNTNLSSYLMTAALQKPTDVALQKELAAYYIITEEKEKADSVIVNLEKEKVISEDQQSYANDLVASVMPSNTLIVHGFADLLPSYKRLDPSKSTIISIDLMQSESYRQSLINQGFQLPTSSTIDTAYFREFCTLNKYRNLQLSMTIPKEYLQVMASDLFPIGLTFGLNEELIDTYSWNNHLWHDVWDQVQLLNATSTFMLNNYLPTLISLKKQYELMELVEEAAAVNKVIVAIASKTQLNDKVKKYAR